MNITQIQVTYVDAEDRMVMRVSFGFEQSLVLALTRRICRFILENITELEFPVVHNATPEPVASTEESANPKPPSVRDDRPLLIENAECQRTRTEARFIFFARDVGQINVNLSAGLAKGLEALLFPLVNQAGWFTPLIAQTQRRSEQDVDGMTSTVLH
jgi:hypothetical protein